MELVLALLAIGVTVAIILYVTSGVYKNKSPLEEALVGETAKVEVSEVKVTAQPKLPTAKKLAEMTKAQLVDLGAEFGVAVNKTLKKDELILDLKAKVKAAQKAAK